METKFMEKYSRRNFSARFVIALAFIVAGLVYVGRNLGIVAPYWFNIIISWQMILIVAAVVQFVKVHIWNGLVLLAIGVFFLLPDITNVGYDVFGTYWPLIFVFVGLSILFERKGRHSHDPWDHANSKEGVDKRNLVSETYASDNGFVESNNTFGSIRQIVLDPVFRGARLTNTFGGIVLDLRRTKLETAETVIEVDCTFGGIEIFIPGHWNLQSRVDSVIGGCEDKRFNSGMEIDREHVLIVRGSVKFGGIEFKS